MSDELQKFPENNQNVVQITENPPVKRRGNPNLKKGVVLNPGGRPKLTEEQKAEKFDLIQACRAYAPKAMETLIDLAQNAQQASVRMQAASIIIERAYGKAVQPTDNVIRQESVEGLTADEAYQVLLGQKVA